MSRKTQLYASFDIEADGPIPIRNSMLSLGVALFDIDKTLLSTFYRTFEPLPGAVQDPGTMEWWAGETAAWEEVNRGKVTAEEGMRDFAAWMKAWKKEAQVEMIAFPNIFDATFVRVYLHMFAGEDPCGFSYTCLKAYAAATLKVPVREAAKRNLPKRWFAGGIRHDHIAINDAVDQGNIGLNMIRENLGLPERVGFTVAPSCAWTPPG